MFKQMKRPLLLITFAILLYFTVTNFKQVMDAIFWLIGLFGPFLIGLVIALILNRPYNFFRFRVFAKLGKPQDPGGKQPGKLGKLKLSLRKQTAKPLPADGRAASRIGKSADSLDGKSDDKRADSLRKLLSLTLVYLSFLVIMALLIFAVIPQLGDSIRKLVDNFKNYSASFTETLNGWLDHFGIRDQVWQNIDKMWNDFVSGLGKMLTNDIMPYVINTIGGVTTGVSNFFIGLVSSVYLLAGKEKLIAQLKRLIFALMPQKSHPLISRVARLSNKMFGEFIVGQIANAAVVGVLCFIGMSILRLDYSLLISVLVCVANVIPFFGCVIGAVPSAFILLMVDPMQAFWFVIFITLLQAVDGNIICPRIVGESIGLSGLWVMVSIIVGGSMLGITGMFLGVPLFAVLYALARDFTVARETRRAARQAAPESPAQEDAPVPDEHLQS